MAVNIAQRLLYRRKPSPLRKWHKPQEIADERGIGLDKVLAWINAGLLRAINVAAEGCKKPQWIVHPDDLADFERRRSNMTPTPDTKPARRRKAEADPNITQYYK